jgi:hypothetical protein
MHTFTLSFNLNYSVFDIFRTSKCSSSGRLVHAVLWYFFHAIFQNLVWSCWSPIEHLPRWRTGEGSPDMVGTGKINTQNLPKPTPLPCGSEGSSKARGRNSRQEISLLRGLDDSRITENGCCRLTTCTP